MQLDGKTHQIENKGTIELSPFLVSEEEGLQGPGQATEDGAPARAGEPHTQPRCHAQLCEPEKS